MRHSYGQHHETSAVNSGLSITVIAICAFLAGICISFVSFQLIFLIGAYIIGQILIKSVKRLNIGNPQLLSDHASRNSRSFRFGRQRESSRSRQREHNMRRACKRLSFAICKRVVAPVINQYTCNNNTMILLHKYLTEIIVNCFKYLDRQPVSTYTNIMYHVSRFFNEIQPGNNRCDAQNPPAHWKMRVSKFERHLKVLFIDAQISIITNEDLELYHSLDIERLCQPLNEVLAPMIANLLYEMLGGEPDWSSIYPTTSSADTYDGLNDSTSSTTTADYTELPTAPEKRQVLKFTGSLKPDDIVDKFFSEAEFDPNLAVDSLLYLNNDFRKFCVNTRHKDKIEFINLFHLFRKERDSQRGHLSIGHRMRQEQELLQLEERFPSLRDEMLTSDLSIQEYRGRDIYSKLVWLDSKISQQLVMEALHIYRWNSNIWKVDITSEIGPKIAPFKPQQPKYFERNVRSLWAPKWYLEKENRDDSCTGIDSEGDMMSSAVASPKSSRNPHRLTNNSEYASRPESDDKFDTFETSSNAFSLPSVRRRNTSLTGKGPAKQLTEKKTCSLERGLKRASMGSTAGDRPNPLSLTQPADESASNQGSCYKSATGTTCLGLASNTEIPVMTDWNVELLNTDFHTDDDTFHTLRHLRLEFKVFGEQEGGRTWTKRRQVAKFYELENALVKFHRKDAKRVVLPAKSKLNSLFWSAYLFKSRRESLVKDFDTRYAPCFLKFIQYWLKVPTAKQSELIFKFLGGENSGMLSTFQSEAQTESVVAGSVYKHTQGAIANIITGITVPRNRFLDGFMVTFIGNCRLDREPVQVVSKESYFTCYDENKNQISNDSTLRRSMYGTYVLHDPRVDEDGPLSQAATPLDEVDQAVLNLTNDMIDFKEVEELTIAVSEREPIILGLYDSIHMTVLGCFRFLMKQEFDFHWTIIAVLELMLDAFFSVALAVVLLVIPNSWWKQIYRRLNEELSAQLEALAELLLDEHSLVTLQSSIVPDFDVESATSNEPVPNIQLDYTSSGTTLGSYASVLKDHLVKCFMLDPECNLTLLSRIAFILVPYNRSKCAT